MTKPLSPLNCEHARKCETKDTHGCPMGSENGYIALLARARLGELMPNAVQKELIQDLAQVGIDEENLDAELLALNGCNVTGKNFRTFVEAERRLFQTGIKNREEEKGPAQLSR